MLCDNDHYCQDCQSWMPLDEALKHSEIGHQVVEAAKPTTAEKVA